MFKNFFKLKPKNKLPIIGIEGSGKTCFAWGLGHFLAEKVWGGTTDATRDYFLKITPNMLRNEPIPATYGKQSLGFRIGSRLTVSTYDISGEDFRQAMNVFSSPTANPKSDKSVKQFLALVENSIGLIVVVDLARRITNREAFEKLSKDQQREHILEALAEQVVPLCRGVEHTIKVNENMGKKMLFFIFTKTDIHRQLIKPGKNILTTAYAPLFFHLQDKRISHKEYSVAYTGCRMSPEGTVEYGIKGIGNFILDLHQLGSKNL